MWFKHVFFLTEFGMEGTQEFYYIGQAILKLEFFCLPSSQIIACTTSLTGKVEEKNLDPLKKTKPNLYLWKGVDGLLQLLIVNLRISHKAELHTTLWLQSRVVRHLNGTSSVLLFTNLFSLSLFLFFKKRKSQSKLKRSLARALHAS